ncbi:unnamed protein product [Fraxinus pennsylvanica]|uniref:EGF-like domain-containing protein n=1 Tax=Fraxinus pennsylvanica TaxID=56036 RepID=A0AAD2DLF0_9LAMI|nr:unnamed protein product [Fraxinus pennsylvanica]
MNLVLHTAAFTFLWLQLPLLLADNSNTATATTTAKPGCQNTCGNLTVPYPFGISVNGNCSLSPSFDINCNTSSDPPKAFLGTTDLEVTAIFDQKIWVKNSMASVCYDKDGNTTMYNSVTISLMNTSFSLSIENELTVIGCDDYTLLEDMEDSISACVGICSKFQDLSDGVCSGIGCCQASITKGLQYFYASLLSLNDHLNGVTTASALQDLQAILISVQAAKVSYKDFSLFDKNMYTIIVWPGHYRANLMKIPLLDVDECEDDPCDEYATCNNLPGTYSCECREGFLGDGRKDGLGCILVNSTYSSSFMHSLGITVPIGGYLRVVQSTEEKEKK